MGVDDFDELRWNFIWVIFLFPQNQIILAETGFFSVCLCMYGYFVFLMGAGEFWFVLPFFIWNLVDREYLKDF